MIIICFLQIIMIIDIYNTMIVPLSLSLSLSLSIYIYIYSIEHLFWSCWYIELYILLSIDLSIYLSIFIENIMYRNSNTQFKKKKIGKNWRIKLRGIGITFERLENTSRWNTTNVRYLLYYYLLCVGQFKKKNKRNPKFGIQCDHTSFELRRTPRQCKDIIWHMIYESPRALAMRMV